MERRNPTPNNKTINAPNSIIFEPHA
jgi:hypothetical protein